MNIQEQLKEFLNLPISESAKQDLLDKIDEVLSRADKLGMAAKKHREQAKSAIGLAGVNKHIGQAEKLEQRAAKSRATIAPTPKATSNNDKIGVPSKPKQEAPKAAQPTKPEQPKQESDVTKRTKELIAKHRENISKAAGNPYKDSVMKTLTQGTKKTLDNAYDNVGSEVSKPKLAKVETTGANKPAPTIADRLKKIKEPKEEVKQEVSKPIEKAESKVEQQKLDLGTGTPKQKAKTTKVNTSTKTNEVKAAKVITPKKPKTTKTVASEQVAKKKSGRPKKTK